MKRLKYIKLKTEYPLNGTYWIQLVWTDQIDFTERRQLNEKKINWNTFPLSWQCSSDHIDPRKDSTVQLSLLKEFRCSLGKKSYYLLLPKVITEPELLWGLRIQTAQLYDKARTDNREEKMYFHWNMYHCHSFVNSIPHLKKNIHASHENFS